MAEITAAAAGTDLPAWYRANGRHGLPWRATRDRWRVLVSEVMLHQTQVSRVVAAWPSFIARFPTPAVMAAATPGDVIRAWDRLGYPRRARRLWEAATLIAERGWPERLTDLPGVGRYTAAAIAAQADGADVPAVDVNVGRVVQRLAGRALTPQEADAAAVAAGFPLRRRDRLLALIDVGALVCRAREPRCDECPLHPRCATRGTLDTEPRRRQARFAGSFRERRGRVLAELRGNRAAEESALDRAALASLVEDGLAIVTGGRARLP